MKNDGELCREALRGVRSALAELTRRWAARVVAVCRARVRRLDVAEELAQETLLRAVRSLSTLENPDCFGAWVRGIADRVALDWLKSPQRSQVPFSVLAEPGVDFPCHAESGPQAAERNDEWQRLRIEVDRLPDDCRETLLLFYYDSLTYDELAAVLGVSRATVNARLAKARRLLRIRLGGSVGCSPVPEPDAEEPAVPPALPEVNR